jgi:hypothetical protein
VGTEPESSTPWPADPRQLAEWALDYAEQAERGVLPLSELLARLAEVRATGKASTSIEEWLLMLCRAQGATLEQLAEITARDRRYVNAPNKKLNRLAEQYGQASDRLAALASTYGVEKRTMVDHELLDVEDVIGETWPLNGPYGEYETNNAASAIGELVRYLNYATQYPEGVPYPSTAGSVASRVGSAISLLDQTLEQLINRVKVFQSNPDLYGDDAPSRDQRNAAGLEHVERALVKLGQARRDANLVRQTLSEAASQLGHLGIEEH